MSGETIDVVDGLVSYPSRERFQSPAIPATVSDDGGRFELQRVLDTSVLYARGERQVPVLAFDYVASDPGSSEPLVVVAEQSPVAGMVVDEQNLPLGGVEVCVRVPDDLKSSFGRALVRAELLEYFGTTDERGRFEIPDAPGVQGRRLGVSRTPSHVQLQSMPRDATTDLRIVFRTRAEFTAVARGIVLDDGGTPVADARVTLLGAKARTDVEGHFAVDASKAKRGDAILAGKPGLSAGRGDFDPAIEEVRIQLGSPTRNLAGRILDESGTPMEKAEVRLFDPTLVGSVPIETLSIDEGSGPYTWCSTDQDGRFEIGGLGSRAYTLSVVDPSTMRAMRTAPFQAGGKDVEIRFQNDGPTGRIAGRVIDREGAPVPGAGVHAVRPLVLQANGVPQTLKASTTTDAEGRFVLAGVALDVRGVSVHFPDDQSISFEHPIGPREDLEHLELVAYRRAFFVIDLSGSDSKADAAVVLDDLDRPLSLAGFEGNVTTTRSRWILTGDRSDVAATVDAATTLVLYRGAAEIDRLPIRLVPGEVTILRP